MHLIHFQLVGIRLDQSEAFEEKEQAATSWFSCHENKYNLWSMAEGTAVLEVLTELENVFPLKKDKKKGLKAFCLT